MTTCHNYRPHTVYGGRGNVFTGVCLSTEGVCLCREGSAWRRRVCMKGQPPPPLRYGQPADGTHSTGMHSCCKQYLRNLQTKLSVMLTTVNMTNKGIDRGSVKCVYIKIKFYLKTKHNKTFILLCCCPRHLMMSQGITSTCFKWRTAIHKYFIDSNGKGWRKWQKIKPSQVAWLNNTHHWTGYTRPLIHLQCIIWETYSHLWLLYSLHTCAFIIRHHLFIIYGQRLFLTNYG